MQASKGRQSQLYPTICINTVYYTKMTIVTLKSDVTKRQDTNTQRGISFTKCNSREWQMPSKTGASHLQPGESSLQFVPELRGDRKHLDADVESTAQKGPNPQDGRCLSTVTLHRAVFPGFPFTPRGTRPDKRVSSSMA